MEKMIANAGKDITPACFLKTFSREDDVKFLDNKMHWYSKQDILRKFMEESREVESPVQMLVHLTLEHPQYPLDYSFPSHEEGWLRMKLSTNQIKKFPKMLAVDCEMVFCEDGTEALHDFVIPPSRLTHRNTVKLNELVNPNKAVADYRSEITGLSAEDLNGVTCSLANVQESMKKLLRDGKTILIGHSLNNDLKALKLDHGRVIDISLIFKHGDEANFRRPSLNNLCKAVLGYGVRKEGAPHNCLDDATAAMKLVLAKIESGFDNAIPLVHEGVPEVKKSKLLLHRIPVNVPGEELHKIIPGDFTIEIRDSYGLPQKCVSFQYDSGSIDSFCVRKMTSKDFLGQVSSRKRSFQVEETTTGESKEFKSGQEAGEQTKVGSNLCDGHLKEIERLKQELRQRDEEISNLNKIILALTRKQGLFSTVLDA
ncbi:Small RNA degrading nuclease 1 [Camellia lanceoleosa]|uniref:Small RNA degrading nuclease 1 n=1 Tax=Camellia lanceoleosa TaxID=1840588 RepID=A0ACC0J0T4_9ERIC|nr:Small RNA degrading nuclease 1 [Camellia lanceoleosa]